MEWPLKYETGLNAVRSVSGSNQATARLVTHSCKKLLVRRWSVDLSGPWPLSREGNQYLCVVQDYFSNWIEVYAMPDKTALRIARCLVKFMARYKRVEKGRGSRPGVQS